MRKIGVIVGRFQVPKLHEGHKFLINEVLKKCDKIIIVIGKTETRMTNKNPIPFEFIGSQFFNTYPYLIMQGKMEFVTLNDHKSDQVWSNNLDDLIAPDDYEEVTLYGSRNSFIKHYSGEFKTEEIKEIPNISASQIRESIKHYDYRSEDFLAGMIYAANYKYPMTYPTVDVVLEDGLGNFLLGRKKGNEKYCFIGGFVDIQDENLQAAAKREFFEEVQGLDKERYKYFEFKGSCKIDDWRYKGTKDGIMTSLFKINLLLVDNHLKDKLKASDDLEEVKWFSYITFDKNMLVEEHLPLFKILKPYL